MEKVKISKAKNEVLLSFNEKIYKKEFIDMAVLDFNKVCDIKQDKEKILLKPKEKVDLETIGYEFYNYVLELIKNQ